MKEEYRHEYFKKFTSDPFFKKERSAFDGHFSNENMWLLFEGTDIPESRFQGQGGICNSAASSQDKRQECLSCLRAVLRKAQATKRLQLFVCPISLNGILMPLLRGENIYGYIGLCHLNRALSKDEEELFLSFTETVMEEVRKEMELNKLYDTIRPRAVALSTIHTIHRIITSSLKPDELIGQIARLTLQVLRARRCSIMLVDGRRKFLLPKVSIDSEGKTNALRRLQIGKGIQGKVALTSTPISTSNLISVPLMDEDSIGVITVQERLDGRVFTTFDEEILVTLAEQAVVAIKNAHLFESQEQITLGTIKSLSALLDTKSPQTYTHSNAFVRLALEVAKELKMPDDQLRYLHYAALLPDAGKIGIPEKILHKRARLTKDEYALIKEHPIKGVEVIRSIEALRPAIPLILHHHERFDGKGYPSGLKGGEIPLGARIMAVCDSFEAMVFRRPYRRKVTIAKALEEIKKYGGTQFDPEVVSAFQRVIKRREIQNMLVAEDYGFQ